MTAAGRTNGVPRPRRISLGREISQEKGNFAWVYVWGAPLRAMHWIAAVCVVTLIVTGFYIGGPYFVTEGEASAHYLMGTVRFIHFLSAAVLVMTGIVRVYWLFAGNKFERLPALFPLTPKNFRRMGSTFRAYLTFKPEHEVSLIGHDPLQQIAYTLLYIAMVVMVITGFTMYGQSNPGGWIYRSFAWVPPFVGGLQNVRLIHHVFTWGFIVFVLVHVYFTIRSDYVERIGRVSSMITGGRYVSTDEKYEDYDLAEVPARKWPSHEHEPEAKA